MVARADGAGYVRSIGWPHGYAERHKKERRGMVLARARALDLPIRAS